MLGVGADSGPVRGLQPLHRTQKLVHGVVSVRAKGGSHSQVHNLEDFQQLLRLGLNPEFAAQAQHILRVLSVGFRLTSDASLQLVPLRLFVYDGGKGIG